MEIITKSIDEVTVVEISGELDGKTAPIIQQQLDQICPHGCKTILDMRRVTYLSSAGLRVLLLMYRQVLNRQGQMVVVELSPDLTDTLSETGFLTYLTTRETFEAGLAALAQEAVVGAFN